MLYGIFEDKAFLKRMWSLTLPISLQSLLLALVAAADAIMLGRVDQDSMAAVSLATQIQFIQNMLVWAAVCVVSILGAQYWGKGDRETLEKILGISVRHTTFVCVLFFAGCVFAPRPLMRLFASDPRLVDIGIVYLRWAGWSYLLTGLSQSILAMLKVSDHATRTAWISGSAVVINIILNAVFIFGLCGAPAMGVRGAALATVIARVFELAWCLACARKKGFIRFRISRIFCFDKLLNHDFRKNMLTILATSLLWGVGFASYTAFMGHLGPDSAAANSVAAVVRDLLCCFCNGLCAAAGILVGNELGAGKLEKGKLYGNRLMVLSFIIGIMCTVLVLASIPLVLRFVKLTDQASGYLVGMFVILSVYMIGRTVNTITINGVFYAGGDTFFDTYSVIVAMWLIAVPCALLGTFFLHWHVLLVYGCTCLDEVGKIPWVLAHHYRYKWVKNLTR